MPKPVVAIILGTRPEIIKLAPLICEVRRRNLSYTLIHSNQHYSYEMDQLFFQELGLPQPDFNLQVGSGTQSCQTGNIMMRVEKVLSDTSPEAVLVQGDTNTALGASLAAAKLHIPVCHVEAGLRSWDRTMPEEINRILIDHVSELLFAPTSKSAENLENENIPSSRSFIVGNTIVDTLKKYYSRIAKSNIVADMGLVKDSYILATLHRAENVDNSTTLTSLFSALSEVQEKTNLPVLLPIHPRTKSSMQEKGISCDGLVISQPFGYFDFTSLEENARLIVTDSGGVQEEACVLKVPCVTLRNTTERPETVDLGANVIAGTEKEKIMNSILAMLQLKKDWNNPFGSGDTSSKIIDVMECNILQHRTVMSPIQISG